MARRTGTSLIWPGGGIFLCAGCNIGDFDLVDTSGSLEPPPCASDEISVDTECTSVGMPGEACPFGVAPDGACARPDSIPVVCEELDIEPDWYVSSVLSGSELGTEGQPFRSLQAAVDAAADGDLILIKEGSYRENVAVRGKALRIYGECDSVPRVVLDGSFDTTPTLQIEGLEASGSEVRGLRITGFSGLAVSDATDVVVRDVVVVDTEGDGIRVMETTGTLLSSVSVSNSGGAGIHLVNVTDMMAEQITVSHVRAIGPRGRAVDILGAYSLQLRDVIVSDTPGTGIRIYGGFESVIENVLVDGSGTRGDYATGIRLAQFEGSLSGALVTNTSNVGVEISRGSTVTVSDCWIIDSGQRAPAGAEAIDGLTTGSGIRITSESTVTATACTISGARTAGIHVQGSSVEIDRTWITGVRQDTADAFGDGLVVYPGDYRGSQYFPDAEPRIRVTASLIEAAPRAGIANFGSIVELSATTVRCSDLPVAGEPFGGALARQTELGQFSPGPIEDQGFWFVDEGGNLCGCDDTWNPCGRRTVGLAAATLPGEWLPEQ